MDEQGTKKAVVRIKLISGEILSYDVFWWTCIDGGASFLMDDGIGGSLLRLIPWSQIAYIDAYSIMPIAPPEESEGLDH